VKESTWAVQLLNKGDAADHIDEVGEVGSEKPMKAMKAKKGAELAAAKPVLAARKAVASAAEAGATAEGDWIYGYDSEHEAAWRMQLLKNGKKSKKDWALRLTKPEGAESDDEDAFPVGIWADESSHAIKTITLKELSVEKLIRKKCGGKLWQHTKGVYIKYRKDRSPILILFEETSGDDRDKQLCQILVRHFGDPLEKVLSECYSMCRLPCSLQSTT
jgi:hypothetical protein